jgi:hypothetical protein
MEAIMTIIAVLTGLAVLGGTSITLGADSRESYPDDHQR